MGTALAPSSHVHLDDQGRAWITGTTYRVLDVVADHVVYGFSPSEIQYQHYRDLTLAQIHAALAYYFDHRAELDEALKREALDVDRRKAAAGESPVVKRLRAEGKLP
jgi:uncharacterized protein (DUF433 family)